MFDDTSIVSMLCVSLCICLYVMSQFLHEQPPRVPVVCFAVALGKTISGYSGRETSSSEGFCGIWLAEADYAAGVDAVPDRLVLANLMFLILSTCLCHDISHSRKQLSLISI